MTRKKLYLLVAFSLCFVCIFAQQISQEEALQSAKNFYGTGSSLNSKKKVINHRKSAVPQLKLVYTGGETTQPDYYIYNVENEGGFIIVAGDKRMTRQIPIYSLSGNFNPENIPGEFMELLDNYSWKVNKARGASATVEPLKANKAVTLNETTQVMLPGNIVWHQESPYNDQCPLMSGQRTLAGCGAIAAGQVMKYFNWPLKGEGSYTNQNNGGAKVDYSQQTYDWNKILPAYSNSSTTEQKAEIAKLVYHVGNSFGMRYNLDGSGTGIAAIPSSLWSYFGYSRKMQKANRLTYSNDEWFDLIKREIDLKRPVIYSGDSKGGGGHLFVCDGYDSDGRLHFNYGWGGYLNSFQSPDDCQYPIKNQTVIGIRPNNITVADKDEAYPQVTMLSPINTSVPNIKLGTEFKVGVRVANYSVSNYTGPLAIALYKGSTMVGTPLVQQTQTLNYSNPALSSSDNIVEYNIVFGKVIIPSGTANGTTYKLRLLAKLGDIWIPALGIAEDVVKDLSVTIANGTANFSYPKKKPSLELLQPIDVNVANNIAVAKFSIINVDDFYACENTDIAVLVNPDNSPIPSVFARATINRLEAGSTLSFEIKDIPVAPGTDVNSCRFYVAYSPIASQPRKGRDYAFVPMTPFAYNFKNYQIPKEAVIITKNFLKSGSNTPDKITSDFKTYDKDGKEGAGWHSEILSLSWNAVSTSAGDKLVTPPMRIDDENYVFEWHMRNMYSSASKYILYVSTEGQALANFVTPVYDKECINDAVARISLSKYIGKNICIAFEASINGAAGLMDYRLLNIKTPKDISIQSTVIAGSALSGQTIPVKIVVKNHSAINVTKVNASYTVGTETVNEIFETDIPFNESAELTFQKQIVAKGIPGDIVSIATHVQQDGEEAAQMDNNDSKATFMIVNFFPKKGILIYKTTKIGCLGCMQSYSLLDNTEQYIPGAIYAVELWRNGSFKAPKEFDQLTVEGTTPSTYANGKWYNRMFFLDAAKQIYSTLSPPADIFVQANYADENSRLLKIKIQSKFALPLKGDYKLGAIIIENNVRNIDGQISGTAPTGEKLVKNHLPIANLGGMNGADGKHIIDPQAQTYEYELEYIIPDEAMSGGTSYKYRKDNVQVIGILYGPNGEILNSASDSYYLKLRETDGLTFVPVEGYSGFKRIYDIDETVSEKVFTSIVNYRVTIPVGMNYKFKIEKDASWNNRQLKLIVNSRSNENKLKEELLIPDEYGVYTIENMQQHYDIHVDEVSANDPMVSRKGTDLIFSGTWTAKDFQALRLDYSYLTGVDMTNITIPLGAGDLNITNPNALIYTQKDATVPASWKNVIKGNSAVSIALEDGYPFHNSKTFDAENISYHRSFPYSGWGSAYLPFSISTLPEGILPEEFTKSISTGVIFTETATIKANTPYILNITKAGEKLFAASNVTVEPSNPENIVKGNYSFEGTYSKMAGTEVEGLYILNFDGAGFRTATATNDIPAFRSYVRYIGSNPSDAKLNISHMEAPTSIDNANVADELNVRYTNGATELITMKQQTVKILSIDGCIVKTMDLNEGANRITNLPKGIYLVEGKKIIIK